MKNIERLSNAIKHPEKFPYAYQTLRKKFINKEMQGIIFKHSGRLWFDHDAWSKELEEARKSSLSN
jgi:hypothetical protein